MPDNISMDYEQVIAFGKYLKDLHGQMQATCTITKKHLLDGRGATSMSVITALFDQIEELVGEIEKLIAELDTAGQDQIDSALAYKAILDEMEEELKKVKTR